MNRALLCLFLFSCGHLQAEPLQASVKAESAIVINADTGVILYEKNAHELQFPASTTKIATALYTLKLLEGHLDVILKAEQEAIGSVSEAAKQRSNYTLPSWWLVQDASHMGIKKGEELSLETLLYGMMLSSADDASNVIAQYAGGTILDFMKSLNSYLKELGCRNTQFNNPHGLHHPSHRTTAYDLALITKEALKNETFCKIVKTVRYKRPKTNKQEATTLVQFNKLLKPGKFYYPHAIGVKTGYTSKAQNTFVGAATKEGRTLIVVLLKVKDRDDLFRDAIKLFQAAFDQPKIRRVVLRKGDQPVSHTIPEAKTSVQAILLEDVILEYYPAEAPKLKCHLFWDNLLPPIKKGQKIGEYHLTLADGTLLQTVPLLAKEDVKPSLLYDIQRGNFKKLGQIVFLVLFVLGMGLVLLKCFKKR